MDGPAIFDAARDAYARCSSYQDAGDVVTVTIRDSPRPMRRTESRPFSTWFIRPSRFRFEYTQREVGPADEWHRYVIWERDGRARGWWTVTGAKESTELPTLLAGAAGVSGGSSHRVPRLLMPERFKRGIAPRVTLAGSEDVNGVACHRLDLAFQLEDHVNSETLWIGTDDLLIRKVFEVFHLGGEHSEKMMERTMEKLRKAHEEGQLGGRSPESFPMPRQDIEPFRAEHTTTYVPQVGVSITDDTFTFEPPS